MAKSKQLSPSLWALIGVGLYLALQKGAGFIAQQFQVLTPRINFQNPTFQGIQADVIVPIQNNTPASVPLDSLVGVVKYGTQALASVNINQAITIDANTTIDIPIDFDINYAQVGSSLINIINGGNYSSNFIFQGQAVVAGIVIPINQRIPLL